MGFVDSQFGTTVLLTYSVKKFKKCLEKRSTGLFIIIGTTFGGCTEPQSDLTKILFNDYMKIIIKTSYDY